MAVWRRFHPEDVVGEEEFWVAKKAKRRDRMRRKCFIEVEFARSSTLEENDDRWDDLIITTEESSGAESSDHY
jgi:hypothetical protein